MKHVHVHFVFSVVISIPNFLIATNKDETEKQYNKKYTS